MGVGTFIHHIGTFLLLVALVLLIVVDVTAPVVNKRAIMRVHLGNTVPGNQVTFGTFGYCHLGIRDSDECSHSRIGYNPAAVMSRIDGSTFSRSAERSAKVLTRVMVLHPIATFLCLVALLLCIAAGMVGSFLAAIFAGLAFLTTIIAMICDFVLFSIIKHDVNKHGRSRASWSSGIWLMLVSAICTLLASAIVFSTCCVRRSSKRRATQNKDETWTETTPAPRRHFWQRR
ncbi:hypothetical protein CDD82_5260 [Ophiocordyceps australis]|uniref:Pali-domain-containing protein n=1 Tax=Ophiocordyceps australis TaxID=1399860 RepID=A0A2C5YW80_9HYPO|nr:hypothetical protein CDD82_5260 [Ophiocordyceps australis]